MLAAETLQAGLVGYAKMGSSFAALRLLVASPELAWAGQAIVSAVALAVMLSVAVRRPGGRAEVAVLAVSACLATPFLLTYDLLLLAIPLAVTATQASRAGFWPWERIGLAGAYALPLVAPALAKHGVPIVPVVLAGLLLIVCRRAGRPNMVTAGGLAWRRVRRRG